VVKAKKIRSLEHLPQKEEMRMGKAIGIKEEINKELINLILEVLHRLERENPELLKLLFPSSEQDNISKSKNRSIKEPSRDKVKVT
jgi:hypothetical protein